MITPQQRDETMGASQADFRKVLGRFATGVTVVTTCDGDQRLGITVNAFSSLSLDPLLILVCIEKTSYLHQAMLRNGYFAVNLLGDDQEALSRGFAGHSEARRHFYNTPSHTEVTGAPILDHSLGWVDCRIQDVFPGGDHSIIVGRVEALGAGDGHPLLYYRGKYPKIDKTSAG
jgi:3-hydroxy-9,10-secoandrosta-1,3,5(10)-triene-9,17-dione monooxygenase reductase component